jgi:hypothetical protein
MAMKDVRRLSTVRIRRRLAYLNEDAAAHFFGCSGAKKRAARRDLRRRWQSEILRFAQDDNAQMWANGQQTNQRSTLNNQASALNNQSTTMTMSYRDGDELEAAPAPSLLS